MSQEKVEVVRRIFEASARRDVEAIFALYDPEVEFDGSRHRWAEVMGGEVQWKGHAALRRFFARYYEMWERFEFDIEELLDVGGYVISVVTSRARGRSSGVIVEWTEQAAIWTIRESKHSASCGSRRVKKPSRRSDCSTDGLLAVRRSLPL